MTELVNPKGVRLYREVLGKEPIDPEHPHSLEGVRAFTVNHLFANVWSRSEDERGAVFTLRERRLVTIALLAAQGRTDQLMEHLRGARRVGLEKADLLELMIHVAHYAGWAAGTGGQKAVQDVFSAESP
jgi:4-carboxymuconolactone decarboxylase